MIFCFFDNTTLYVILSEAKDLARIAYLPRPVRRFFGLRPQNDGKRRFFGLRPQNDGKRDSSGCALVMTVKCHSVVCNSTPLNVILSEAKDLPSPKAGEEILRAAPSE